MLFILVNYNTDPSWVKDYTTDYLIYDRSDDKSCLKNVDPKKVIHTRNIGQVDYDKLCYLVDNYENLPEVFLWGKANFFKSISKSEFEFVKDNRFFTPLLTRFHRVSRPLCFYDERGMYNELNEDAFIHVAHKPTKFYHSYKEFANHFGLPNDMYLTFAPGGNYILTKYCVQKYPKSFYEDMRDCLPHDVMPAEAYMCERSYYTLWK